VKRVLVSTLALLTLVLGACSSSSPAKSKGSELLGAPKVGPYEGAGLNPPQPRPSFTLTDTSGKPFAFGSRTAGHPTFLFFGYTECPDVCPETLGDIATATRNVPAAMAKGSYVVFVTTDIKHDTGPVIAQWLANFSRGSKATFVGLRGTQAQIDAAQAAAHITLATDDGKTHSASALLYGPDDYARVLFLQSNNEAKAMEHDLKIVAKDSA
jgi:protein SCO1/2